MARRKGTTAATPSTMPATYSPKRLTSLSRWSDLPASSGAVMEMTMAATMARPMASPMAVSSGTW